jgi:hypothetical protein
VGNDQLGRSEIERANARLGALEQERSSWISHAKDISDNLLPRAGRYFVEDRNRGEKRHNNIYDSTATRALRVLGAGLMGGASSPARPWFRYSTPDHDLMRVPAVKQWLSQITRISLDIMAKSNTYRMLHSTYEELGAFGTGASVMMDDFERVIHNYPMTFGEFSIATDFRGEVNTLYRRFQKRVVEVVGEFGYENCSTSLRTMYDNGNYDTWVTLAHALEPRKDRDTRMRDAKNMPFRSIYWEIGENEKLLRESGFKRFRGIAPRWQISGGDIYGNSPGMEALGDIRQLQHEQLRKAEGIDYKTKPPLQVPVSMRGRAIERFPGGVSYYDPASGAAGGIKTAFEVNLDLSHLLADIQDVRQRIRETFYTDLFLMLSGQNVGTMTATEVAERHEEKLLMLGPVLERLHNELFEPLVTMTFQRMLEIRMPDGTGIVPPPPEELAGNELNIEFTSILAQAQRAVSTNSIDRFTMALGQVAAAKPDVLDKFDADKWVDIYSDSLGVDPELIIGDDKVAIVRKDRAAQAQAAMAAQTAQVGADAANKLGNTPTQGKNALTDIMSGLTGYSTPGAAA